MKQCYYMIYQSTYINTLLFKHINVYIWQDIHFSTRLSDILSGKYLFESIFSEAMTVFAEKQWLGTKGILLGYDLICWEAKYDYILITSNIFETKYIIHICKLNTSYFLTIYWYSYSQGDAVKVILLLIFKQSPCILMAQGQDAWDKIDKISYYWVFMWGYIGLLKLRMLGKRIYSVRF